MTGVIICILILLLIAATYVLLLMPRVGKAPDRAPILTDYAHRGIHDNKRVPENSLAAFRLAVENGFAIEFDIQLSSDGEIFVFHDATLDRMCGVHARVSDLPAEKLKGLRLLGTNERIPTFAEVLALVGGQVPLLVELKGESLDDTLCWKAAPMFDEYGYRGDFCIESFNPFYLQWFKSHRPEFVRGQLVGNMEKGKPKKIRRFLLSHLIFNWMARPDFIAHSEDYSDRVALWLCVRVLHATEFVWTVRSEKDRMECHRRKAYSIFENFVPQK